MSDDGDEDTRSCNGRLFVVGDKIQGSSLGDAMAAMEGARMTTRSGQSGQTTAQAAKYVE